MAENVLSKASGNYKTRKSVHGNRDGGILYLAPANTAGLGNVCPWASKGCKASCLYTAGRGVMAPVQAGRVRKTRMFFLERDKFFRTLHAELTSMLRNNDRKGFETFCRLNGTSDIAWETFKVYNGKNVFQEFPRVHFYDYTKGITRLLNNQEPNYTLTFSLSENNEEKAKLALSKGFNVSAVFLGKELPKTWWGYPVLDGDKEDLQYLYPKGVIVGLRAKGKARYDTTGFAVNLNERKYFQRTGLPVKELVYA